MINADLIKRVEDKVLETYITLQNLYRRSFVMCHIEYQLNSKRIAGQAFLSRNLIKINPTYLAENPDEMINITVPHEIAHLATHTMYPHAKQAHGPEWKSVMRAIGLPPNPYHNMLIKSRAHNSFNYKCDCQTFMFSPIQHKRAQSLLNITGKYKYHCKKCKGNCLWVKSV